MAQAVRESRNESENDERALDATSSLPSRFGGSMEAAAPVSASETSNRGPSGIFFRHEFGGAGAGRARVRRSCLKYLPDVESIFYSPAKKNSRRRASRSVEAYLRTNPAARAGPLCYPTFAGFPMFPCSPRFPSGRDQNRGTRDTAVRAILAFGNDTEWERSQFEYFLSKTTTILPVV